MSRNPETLAQARVLLLDITHQPSSVITWQKAMTMLTKGSVVLVDSYHNVEVRSVNNAWLCPAVLAGRGRPQCKAKEAPFTRLGAYKRDGFQCQYCGNYFGTSALTLDHVLPKSQGGKLTWENAVTACKDCNGRKANKTPAQAGMSVLNHPCAPGYMNFADLHDLGNTPDAWAPYLAQRSAVGQAS